MEVNLFNCPLAGNWNNSTNWIIQMLKVLSLFFPLFKEDKMQVSTTFNLKQWDLRVDKALEEGQLNNIPLFLSSQRWANLKGELKVGSECFKSLRSKYKDFEMRISN